MPPQSWRASDAARNPIGSGPYRFVRWVPKAAVELVADTAYYRGAPKLSRLIWTIAPDFNAALTRFLNPRSGFPIGLVYGVSSTPSSGGFTPSGASIHLEAEIQQL